MAERSTLAKPMDVPLSDKPKTEDLTLGGKYSNGTGALALQLTAHIQSFGCQTDTILINIDTLLRNRLGKIGDEFAKDSFNYNKMIERSAHEMVVEVAKELEVFVKSIIKAYQQTRIEKPYMLLYAPAYWKILPKEILRPATGQRLMLQQALDGMIAEIKKSKLDRDITIDGVTVRYLPMVEKTSVPRALVYIVRRLKNKQQVLMVSHQAIDWHICDVVRNMVLLESHTGNYKHPDQFGQKAFGCDIPFLPATHAVLGDKSLIVPAIKGKEKNELMDLATQQQWDMRTTEFVSDAIRRKGWVNASIESFFKAR